MIHDTRDVTGKITITLDSEDWVWMCELLAEIVNQPDADEFLREDTQHALNTLQSFEAGE